MSSLKELSARLDAAVDSVLGEGFGGAPPEFRRVASRVVEACHGPFPGLLACAASRWCGAGPEAGLPAAVAAVLLRAALLGHAALPEFSGFFSDSGLAEEAGEADTLLAGDALIPLALEHLAASGGVHSTLLVRDAVRALSGEGVLEGFSLELDLAATGRPDVSEEGGTWRVHAGKLARFASQGGARLAGGTPQLLDDSARIGLCMGLAMDIVQGNPYPSRRARSRGASTAEASVLLDEALGLIGNGPEGDLYRQLIDMVWGEDLFSGVDQG